MKLIPLLMILTGVILIYSAKKGDDPRNVIYEALGIKRRVSTGGTDDKKGTGPGGVTVPDLGYNDVPHDAWGRPLSYPTNTPGTQTVSV